MFISHIVNTFWTSEKQTTSLSIKEKMAGPTWLLCPLFKGSNDYCYYINIIIITIIIIIPLLLLLLYHTTL